MSSVVKRTLVLSCVSVFDSQFDWFDLHVINSLLAADLLLMEVLVVIRLVYTLQT